jgi:hypothetical protein
MRRRRRPCRRSRRRSTRPQRRRFRPGCWPPSPTSRSRPASPWSTAVDDLARRGAERVTGIAETTRKRLRTLLTRAADEGWSYQRTAKEITALYRGFAGPPLAVRPRHLRSRAEAIAVFELGDAYEHGNLLVAQDLQDAGLEMEKSWLTVGDDRVRTDHRANQGEGWIPLDQAFGSGDDRPPADPGCRCTLLMRRKPDA